MKKLNKLINELGGLSVEGELPYYEWFRPKWSDYDELEIYYKNVKAEYRHFKRFKFWIGLNLNFAEYLKIYVFRGKDVVVYSKDKTKKNKSPLFYPPSGFWSNF